MHSSSTVANTLSFQYNQDDQTFHSHSANANASALTNAAAIISKWVTQQAYEDNPSATALTGPLHSKPADFHEVDINTVIGQMVLNNTDHLFSDNPNWLSETTAGMFLKQFSTTTQSFLSSAERVRFNVPSTYTPQVRQHIGLLRGPAMDESTIINRAYNLSMAQEALILGTGFRNKIQNGERPTANELWSACREWRVSQLNAHTSEKEIGSFSATRLGVTYDTGDEAGFETAFMHSELPYQHVFGIFAQKIQQSAPELVQYPFTLADGQQANRLSIQFSVPVNGQQIPLTIMRTVFTDVGQILADPWTHSSNIDKPINSNTLEAVEEDNLNHGLMFHTRSKYLPALEQLINHKVQAFSAQIRQHRALSSANLSHVETIKSLGDIHYLLTQTALDFRGSAAKSELFVRALAVAAGIELPPFRKGFVPDLEAFMNSPTAFIDSYPKQFDYHVA